MTKKTITEEQLEEQLESLINQRNHALSTLHKLEGAITTVSQLYNDLTGKNEDNKKTQPKSPRSI